MSPPQALSEGEAAHLFERLRALQNEGVTILYISHRLPEIFSLCDAITVLRDGRHVATQPTNEVDAATIVWQMVGRELESEIEESPTNCSRREPSTLAGAEPESGRRF
jgi:ABC-type sugar transport system ATPase subunit